MKRPVKRPRPTAIEQLISVCDTEAFHALMIGAACERSEYGTEAGRLQHIHDLLATVVAEARAVKARITGRVAGVA